MSGKTHKARALVLKKTRLGEKDLIITMLDQSGALTKGVAKGARKPGGSFAAKMELFSTVDVLFADGKSLDIICEARLVNEGKAIQFGLEQAACASPIAEMACLLAQEDLEQPRFFDMTKSAFDHVRVSAGSDAVALCAAALWKMMAQAGFRPRFDACAMCGSALLDKKEEHLASFSFTDGGVICDSCRSMSDIVKIESATLNWCQYFIATPFGTIAEEDTNLSSSFSCIQLARQWARTHLGRDMKSLDFLLTGGLF